MTPYIREVIDDFSKYDPGSKTARTPAADHLFKVRDDARPISEKLAQTFHTFVAKSLFATKRARPDIASTVYFLTTRVIEPDEDDWKKLVRMIRPLTLKADSTNIVKWWVDGSYAVHPPSLGRPSSTMDFSIVGETIVGRSIVVLRLTDYLERLSSSQCYILDNRGSSWSSRHEA